jgi:hypothetical protein
MVPMTVGQSVLAYFTTRSADEMRALPPADRPRDFLKNLR